ncbi:MAG: LamG-like jellyroll fold domain-containing protein [Azospirillaceae bacterium]
MKILGYCDRMSAAPGETVRVMVSCQAAHYSARLVRVIHGDANPAGPGFKVEAVASTVEGRHPGRVQSIDAGSYMRVADHPRLAALAGSFTIAAMVWPTTPEKADQTLVARLDARGRGLHLGLDGAEGLALSLTGAGGAVRLATGAAMQPRRWYLVAASIDTESGHATLIQRPLESWPGVGDAATVAEAMAPPGLPAEGGGDLTLAGAPVVDATAGVGPDIDRHFNGKIDSPALLGRALTEVELDGLFRRPMPEGPRRDLIAAWDFSREMTGTRAVDIGPHGLHGTFVNLPARAMKGWNWSAETIRWTERPDLYGAVHFHDDDLYDAGWQPDLVFALPDDLKSGVYAVHLSCGDAPDGTEEDYVTLFVRPPRGAAGRTKRPKVAFLAPTASYLAYANDHNHLDAEGAEMLLGRMLVYQMADLYLHEHRELGLSLYDSHSDGSGVCYSSAFRPILNLRPKYASWLGAHGSGLWQFNADTHLIDWLEHEGFDYDVITDEDLEKEGVGLLEPYRVVLSGTHPEYHSKPMSDAVLAWLDQGGRLMYLGANGWYWRIAWHPTLPGVIEVRRAEDGIRTWAAEPGEYYHSFTGEYGGLWRRNGRPPNVVVGLGFSAQGFDLSSYYRRQPGSHDPRVAFIFDGVEDEIIGDFGLVGGGAAGLELDRADFALGTPPNLLVLASSENHTDLILVVAEEVLVSSPDLTGSQSDLCRADLAFYETPAGGAVFSTGSIAWCGSLSHAGYDNNVSRITGNVLRRFLEPTPFAP